MAPHSSSSSTTPPQRRSRDLRKPTQYLAAWSLGKVKLRLPAGLWLAPVFAFVVYVYAFFGSAGHPMTSWPAYTGEYDMLADAFRQGHTYLPIVPHPDLVAKANPYDQANIDLWVLDDSYYKGKYYLYWGPVPALLQALAKSALGIVGGIGDQYIVAVAWVLAVAATMVLFHRLSRRLFGALPPALLVSCMLAFAFANPVLHLVSTACMYQAAISAGQGFLWIGIALACETVFRSQRSGTQRIRLLLVGLAFGLSLGSRLSLGLAIAAILATTLLFIGPWNPRHRKLPLFSFARWRDALGAGLWMALPLSGCVLGLMLYNKARFDDYFESGIRLQLSSLPYRFSFSYFPANLYAYFCQKFAWTREFPYVRQLWQLKGAALPEWIDFPSGYFAVEPHVGILRVVPIVWLAPIGLGMLLPRARQPWRNASARSALFIHAGLCFFFAGTLGALAVWGLYVPSMRYLGDFSSGLIALGILAGLALYARVRERRLVRRVAAVVVGALAVSSMVFGMLLGYQGYNAHFEKKNPGLHEKLKRALSL